MYASKSNSGIVLIEMLMSIVVVSFIMMLLMSLMTMIATSISKEHVDSKTLQISGLIIDDLVDSIDVTTTSECIIINQNKDTVTYCIEGEKMIRRVNGKGYERVLNEVNIKLQNNGVITLVFTTGNTSTEIPLWSNN